MGRLIRPSGCTMDTDELILQQLRLRYPEADEWYRNARATKVSLEEYLYRQGKVPAAEVLEVKAHVLTFPKGQFNPDTIPPEILSLIPEQSARLYQIIAFARDGDRLSVGAVDPKHAALDELTGFLQSSLRLEPKIYVIALEDFYRALRRYHNFASDVRHFVEEFRKGQPVRTERAFVFGEGLMAEESPVIKLVELVVREAVQALASDIHFEPLADRMKIRFRIQGELRVVGFLPKDIHAQIVNRIKVLAKLKLDETRIPQDGRIRIIIDDREIDFRIGVLPTIEGEKISMRILDPLVGLKTLEGLGIAPHNLEKIRRSLARPHGLILITGPTGSGKTTTLYAMLQEINQENINIISLEDPVEYRVEGINQSQVAPEANYTFSTGLREILRQDPDVILVGEIRDRETAELATHAALTGHLVLATLHTNDAIGSINRLVDIGVERFLLAPTLQFLIAQRLVRQLCPACRQSTVVSAELEMVIDRALASLSPSVRAKQKLSKPYATYRSGSCNQCGGKGAVGRVALIEVIEITDELRQGIETNKSEAQLREHLAAQGFISMRQDGILKALQGTVSLEEVLKSTE